MQDTHDRVKSKVKDNGKKLKRLEKRTGTGWGDPLSPARIPEMQESQAADANAPVYDLEADGWSVNEYTMGDDCVK